MVSEVVVRVLVNEAAAVVKVGVLAVLRTLGRMKARVVEVRAKATVDGRMARRQVAMRKRTIAFFVCSVISTAPVERRYPRECIQLSVSNRPS
jgi:hypothetical protein